MSTLMVLEKWMLPLLLQLAPVKTLQNRGSDPVPTHAVPTEGNPQCALGLLLHPSPTNTTKGTRASHKLLFGTCCKKWKNSVQGSCWDAEKFQSWRLKDYEKHRYTYLHLPPCYDPKEACTQEAAHLLSNVFWLGRQNKNYLHWLCCFHHTAISL